MQKYAPLLSEKSAYRVCKCINRGNFYKAKQMLAPMVDTLANGKKWTFVGNVSYDLMNSFVKSAKESAVLAALNAAGEIASEAKPVYLIYNLFSLRSAARAKNSFSSNAALNIIQAARNSLNIASNSCPQDTPAVEDNKMSRAQACEILGVDFGADNKQIKDAWKAQRAEYELAALSGNKAANEKAQKINEAYEILCPKPRK